MTSEEKKIFLSLTSTIDRLEKSLNAFNEKNTSTSGGGNNPSTSTSNYMYRNLNTKNPYNEKEEKQKFDEFQNFLEESKSAIKEREDFQKDLIARREQNEIKFWEKHKNAIIKHGEFELDIQQRRQQKEVTFWNKNRGQIKSLEKYKIDLQYKRQQIEINFWKDRKKEVKELDALETELLKRRKEKEFRGRRRALELENKTTDNLGRTKANKEFQELKNKWREFKEENTKSRQAGVIISKAGSVLNNGVNFLSSDNRTSITDIGNKVSGTLNNLGPYGQAAGAIVNLITAGVEAYDKINAAASKYSREVGGGAAKMSVMKNDAVHIANSISKWGGLTYKFDKILEHVAELSSKTGRVMDHMSEMDFKSLEDLYRHGITSDVIAQYDTFGLSVETIDKRIKSIYNNSGKHGLNAKAVTSAVANNLKIAQNYTFTGGQRALERMAEKSIALKYNMQSVAAFADKVSTLEGAAQAGAGLSVLGGNFARMGNPLSLLYGGLQDAEKLNDMMLNMTRDMAMWDSRNKEMRISAYNRQRLRAASQQMGVSYDDLVNQAMMQGKRERINNQLDRTGKITSEDTREYIRNLAQLDENGRAYIRFNGSTENTYLDKLTEKDKERLAEESKRMEDKQNAKIGDVYEQTRTITDRLNDYIDWIKTKFFDVILRIARFGDKERGKMRGLNESNAEFFNDMSDDYYHGGMSDAGLRRLSELGATTEEIQRIKKRELSDSEFDDFVLKKIMNRQNEGYSKDVSMIYSQNNNNWKYTGKVENKAHGGIIRGKGTSLSDSIPAKLSNGEFVMNAKATQQHLPTLQAWNAQGFNRGTETPIKTGNNSMNSMTVNKPMSTSITSHSVSTPMMTIEPININLSGTIDLRADGFNHKIDADEIFTNEVVSKLIRKIQEATNYRLDKTNVNVHMKYPMA